MIISHSHKFIFIKSQKTAGTSVEAALSNYCSGNDIVTPLGKYRHNREEDGKWIHRSMNAAIFHQHDDSRTIRNNVDLKVWNSYFKFSITRNPWDRMVSLFVWLQRNESDRNGKNLIYRIGSIIGDVRRTRRSFSNFVKGDWENNDHYYIIDGKLCVDYVIRYENLLEDVKQVCDRIGIEEVTLPYLKAGFRRRHHYSDYYDEEIKAIVAERHAHDIRLFGYQFECK